MRKSLTVPLNLLASLARFVTGRQATPETRVCVDEQRRIVSEINCKGSALGTSYYYIYGGTSDGNLGDIVIGGSTVPKNETGVSRGGFGYSGNDEGGGG
jgi:hypothetical protein